ncbi:hypothetical protein XthCFBP4691_12280 [Xanthomonas theicola]|uniref:Surface presentation of antigens protein SpaO n=1 Tax=Xanthomonas theicola TaxID=56464 RepID=A0A2S6ZE62_9XANT|nr:hypothetical protein XthCFBP4691_12280 [Xanthomonas theicola]
MDPARTRRPGPGRPASTATAGGRRIVKLPSLRRITTAQARARAALARWPQRDPALGGRLAYTPAPRAASLVAVQAYRHGLCWRGYVDLAEWLACTAPELAALAATAQRRTEHARSLFEASERPLDMPFPELDYDLLRIGEDPGQDRQAQDQCLLSLATPQGRVWFGDFPDVAVPSARPLSASIAVLPLQIAWQIGRSHASRRLIGRMRCGDVLLIEAEAFELTSAGMAIGGFSINEDGEISMHPAIMKEHNGAAKEERGDGCAAPPAMPTAAVAASLADVPLRLDFILQRRTVTVAELDALYQGQFLQLDPEAEKKVEIAVNGMRLATGELVELNGRLGVELHDIGGGKALAQARRV